MPGHLNFRPGGPVACSYAHQRDARRATELQRVHRPRPAAPTAPPELRRAVDLTPRSCPIQPRRRSTPLHGNARRGAASRPRTELAPPERTGSALPPDAVRRKALSRPPRRLRRSRRRCLDMAWVRSSGDGDRRDRGDRRALGDEVRQLLERVLRGRGVDQPPDLLAAARQVPNVSRRRRSGCRRRGRGPIVRLSRTLAGRALAQTGDRERAAAPRRSRPTSATSSPSSVPARPWTWRGSWSVPTASRSAQ
jgi:hypothetical protein